MPFSEEYDPIKEAIDAAIRGAGYVPLRVDEDRYTGSVMDRILAQIRQSLFVIADFTRNRGGVYYEAGFASALGVRVIHTCEERCLDPKDPDHVDFDVRHLRFIAWKRDAPCFRQN
jgi:nucleoside 2-deoxyribosyltransferase